MTSENNTTPHKQWPHKCQIKVSSNKCEWSGREHERDATLYLREWLTSQKPDNTEDWVRNGDGATGILPYC